MKFTEVKTDLEKRVVVILDEALELANLGGGRHVSVSQIAERVYDSEPGLMQEATRLWMIERLTWMLGRRRRARWNEKYPDNGTLLLPEIFNDLPKAVFLPDGRRPKLDLCKLSETEENLTLLRKRYRSHYRITQMEAVVDLMRTYNAVQRGITWGEVKRRVAEERRESEK